MNSADRMLVHDRTLTGAGRSEKRQPEATDAELRTINEGYAALDQYSNGKYSEFLKAAAGCARCAADHEIPPSKRPLSLMCGLGYHEEGPKKWRGAYERLATHRRADGTLSFSPHSREDIGRLRSLLAEDGLQGLAIGHCGWGDLTARIRGADLAHGVKLMVLGADWYPLSRCANFLLDRYPENDITFGNFARQLGIQRASNRQFFIQHRVYLGNALLCYRTGFETTGTTSLSRKSFENCRDHLSRHIEAVQPAIIVTFGVESCRSVASLVTGESERMESLIEQLRKPNYKLKDIMTAAYREFEPRGLSVKIAGRSFAFVPLFHPSYSHINKYPRDYEALRNLLGMKV